MTYDNSVQVAGSAVAAMVLERAMGGTKGTVAGFLVQPAVWVATRSGPDAVDTFTYAASAFRLIVRSARALSIPTLLTSAVKAYVDDETQTLVDEAKKDEPLKYRPGIFPLGDYSFWARGGLIQAMTIAHAGGVVWKHPNGALMFIRDWRGLLVCDYEPATWKEVYKPALPLRKGSNGKGVSWNHIRR